MKRFKIEINPYLLFPTPDRFSGSGYREPVLFDKALDDLLRVEDLDGIGLHYPAVKGDQHGKALAKKIHDHGKDIGSLGINYWSKEWGLGSFSAADKATRDAAVDSAKKAIDTAHILGVEQIFIWPAHDGTEYAFQADFMKSWDWMVEGLTRVMEHDTQIKVGIEYKMREPRTHCFIATVGDVIDLVDQVGAPNIGATVDLGHSLMAGERMAHSVARCLRKDILYLLHWGDNYRGWDDDLIVGTVNIIDFLETTYWLKKTGWEGWSSIDQVAFKNNAFDGVVEALRWIRGFEKFVDDVGLEKLDTLITDDDPKGFSSLVRNYMFTANG